jgi:hypothetical protein
MKNLNEDKLFTVVMILLNLDTIIAFASLIFLAAGCATLGGSRPRHKPDLIYYGLDLTATSFGSDRLQRAEIIDDYGPAWNRTVARRATSALSDGFDVHSNLGPSAARNGELSAAGFGLMWDEDRPPAPYTREQLAEIASNYTRLDKRGVGCVLLAHYVAGSDDYDGDIYVRVVAIAFDHMTGQILSAVSYTGESSGMGTKDTVGEALVDAAKKAFKNLAVRAWSIAYQPTTLVAKNP